MHYLTGDVERSDSTHTSARHLWNGLRRQRWLIAGVTLLSIAVAAIALALIRPRYESQATLRIVAEDRSSGLLGSLPTIADVALPGLGSDEIDTELGVLRSRRIAEAVVDSLSLQVELIEPRVTRDSVLRIVDVPRDASAAVYTYRPTGDGGYSLTAVETEIGSRGSERATIGEEIHLGEVTVALVPEVAALEPERIRIRVRPYHRVVEELQRALSVDKQEGRSELVEISYRSTDRKLAFAVVNSVVETYLEYTSETDHRDLRKRVETLGEQVDTYEAQLSNAEDSLRDFRREHRIVDPEEEATQQVRLLADVTAGRETAVIESQALRRLLAEVERDDGQSGAEQDASPYRKLAAFPSFIANLGVQAILESLTEMEDTRSELLLLRTPENADVRRTEQRITELEQQLHRLATDYLSSLENQIASADASLNRFGVRIEALPDRELAYARLLRQQRLLNEVYLNLQARLKEAEVQFAVAPEAVRVIDPALLPVEPVSPKPVVMMILATILGLMVGVAVAAGREAVDTAVRSQWEAEVAAGGAPVLGIIPRMRGGASLPGMGWVRRVLPAVAGGGAPNPQKLIIGSRRDQDTAEAFQSLRRSLSASGPERALQVIGLTSPRSGGGTTLSAANLAISFARQGERVALVDADLREGDLFRLVRGARAPGLGDVLAGTVPLETALQELDLDHSTGRGITFLPSGNHRSDASDLLASEAMGSLIRELRARFDRIILDTPALHQVADGALVGAHGDALILVIRWGWTDRGVLQQTVTRLRRMAVPIGGMILNEVEVEGVEYHALPSRFEVVPEGRTRI